MSRAIAAPGVWNILLSQGNTGGFGSSPRDPLNPYASLGGQGMSQPPKRSSNTWLWVLGIGGGVMLLLCCGCGVGMYYAWQGVTGVMGGWVKEQVADDPVIKEHIGEVESVTLNLIAVGEEAERNPPVKGEEKLVFDIKGSKGSGKLLGSQIPQPGPGRVLRNMKLRTDKGEFPLPD